MSKQSWIASLVVGWVGMAPVLFGQAMPTVAGNPTSAAPAVKEGEFRIPADAASYIDMHHPALKRGGSGLRAEFDTYQKNITYFRFYVGWVAGRTITGATLKITAADWGEPGARTFPVYQLREGTDGDAPRGWAEHGLCADNAPAYVKDSNQPDPKVAEKLGDMVTGQPTPTKTGDVLAWSNPGLVKAIADDRNGYITLVITGGGGGNACFKPRAALGDTQPILEIQTNAEHSLDLTKPSFVITAGERQTISGWGTGGGGDHHIKVPGDHWRQNGQNLGTLSDRPDRLKKYFKTMYTDTGSNSFRLWWAIGDSVEKDLPNWERGYIETGMIAGLKEAGVTRFFLCSNPPKRMWAEQGHPDAGGTEPLSEKGVTEYPEYLAEIAATLKQKHGLELYMVTIANEEIRVMPAHWPQVVKNLRKALDARGLQAVKVSGIDWPNNDDYAWNRLLAIQNDPEAWKVMDVCNTHSYAMSASERFYTQFIEGHPGKEFWITETGGSGPTQSSVGKDSAGHMMNDINHGVATWVWHESGLAVHGDHGSVLMGYHPDAKSDEDFLSISPKYHYFKQITTTFVPGTKMRRVWGTTVGDAWYPGWQKPKALASGGQSADGSWSLALLNTAEQNELDARRTFTLAVEELSGVPLVEGVLTRIVEAEFKDVKETQGPKYQPIEFKTEAVRIANGRVTLTVGPNELATIKTKPVKAPSPRN